MLDFIKTCGSLSMPQILQAFCQTCFAVLHLHKQTPPIIHRDLKVNALNYLYFKYAVLLVYWCTT